MPKYFLLYFTGFWIPGFCLYLGLRPRLDEATRSALPVWFVLFIVPCAVLMEYTYLWLDVWTFSETRDPLLGLWLFGAPIEEFLFWFGATTAILLSYLALESYGKIRPAKSSDV